MRGWSLTIVIVGCCLVCSMIYFGLFGFSLETLQIQIRYSARLSFLIFALTFSAFPLFNILQKNYTKWLMVNRKYFGVSFACIHFYHLGLILLKNYKFEAVFNEMSLGTLFVGIITYLFIGLMLITSFPAVSKLLDDKKWPGIHTVGGYLILSVFTYFYINLTREELNYLPLLMIAMTVWILRLTYKQFILKKI